MNESEKPRGAAEGDSAWAGAPGRPGVAGSRPMLWAGLGLGLVLVVGALVSAALQAQSAARTRLPVLGSVGDFALTNQEGAPVSLADLRGHVWVADVIFTRCPGPCLNLTRQVKELQQALAQEGQARLVTLTTDPDFDTPAVLKSYAERFGADPHRWMFLTGPKKQIAGLATGSLKLTAIEKTPGERQSDDDLFVHSTLLVLVDRQSRLRGIFETTGEDVEPAQVKRQIVQAVRQLEHER